MYYLVLPICAWIQVHVLKSGLPLRNVIPERHKLFSTIIPITGEQFSARVVVFKAALSLGWD